MTEFICLSCHTVTFRMDSQVNMPCEKCHGIGTLVSIKQLIQEELDNQNFSDLETVMSTQEGRRFFSWLLKLCQRDSYKFYGNSRDVLEAGMRNVSMALVGCCKALDLPGVDMMHQAEREYIILQKNIEQDIKHKNKGGN